MADPECRESSAPTLTISDSRAVIRLNRPSHHNRIEPADIGMLFQSLSRVEEDDTVRVLMLTGTGPTFCAGYDLVALASAADRVAAPAVGFEGLVDHLESCRVPTVCGLNGPVYGGGVDLALACDFRIAVPTVRMAVPAGELGVHYYHGGLRRFVTRLGLGAAKRLLLLSQAMDAAEMLRIGFLDELVPTTDGLAERLDQLAEILTRVPAQQVLVGMKRTLNRIARADMDADAADAAWAESLRSPHVALAAAERMAARRRESNEVGEK